MVGVPRYTGCWEFEEGSSGVWWSFVERETADTGLDVASVIEGCRTKLNGYDCGTREGFDGSRLWMRTSSKVVGFQSIGMNQGKVMARGAEVQMSCSGAGIMENTVKTMCKGTDS